ncbi:MAG: biotin--[acetyl-CoA-carboxylase] ligase [Burkholderiaceae bacterium]|nr:biotin--[acetyl-CoA-carboxylase] ligase [Burkholderiaceae bacterium]
MRSLRESAHAYAPDAPPPLDADAIAVAAGAGLEVEAVVETESTNTDLLVRARRQAPARPVLRAALAQTAGRGRRGRAWHAAPGGALLFSLARALDGPYAREPSATLACGVAAAETLEALAPVRLKWPNDLVIGGRKLGGVLCEVAFDPAGNRTLVVGIGINLWLDAATQAAIDQPAVALSEFATAQTLLSARERLIGYVARAVLGALAEFEAHGFAPLRGRYLGRLALLDRDVELSDAEGLIAIGTVVDIDAAGRLMVRTATGTRAYANGDITLRVR